MRFLSLIVGKKRKVKNVKKLSEANSGDFEMLLSSVKIIKGLGTAQEQAQKFVDTIYEYFQESLVLLRLFSSVPYSALPILDMQLFDKKVKDSGHARRCNDRTPVLTLLATRGQKPDWNERVRSHGFRCIPLVSGEYVSSLSMLSMQFRKMNLAPGLFDTWETAVVARGRADEFSGMLYVNNAGTDKDELGRMIVPRQEFVAENNVRTVLGFGNGYSNHPAIVTLFAFTNQILSESMMKPFESLIEAYMSISSEHVINGRVFSLS